MRGFLFLLLVSVATITAGQPRDAVDTAPFRTIPKDAVHGRIRHLQEMVVEIDGEPQRLSPGAQIRDASNHLILPVALPASERADAKYLVDGTGNVHRVWLLSEKEKAALPPGPYPK